MVGLLTHGLDFFISCFFFFFNLLSFSLLRFVIELCEPIQVKQLDIANFELFSSTPKDFLVSISDRYTCRDRGFFLFVCFFPIYITPLSTTFYITFLVHPSDILQASG